MSNSIAGSHTSDTQNIGNNLLDSSTQQQQQDNHTNTDNTVSSTIRIASAPPLYNTNQYNTINMLQQQHQPIADTTTMDPSQQYRYTTEYYQYYYSLKPHDPRLPIPLINYQQYQTLINSSNTNNTANVNTNTLQHNPLSSYNSVGSLSSPLLSTNATDPSIQSVDTIRLSNDNSTSDIIHNTSNAGTNQSNYNDDTNSSNILNPTTYTQQLQQQQYPYTTQQQQNIYNPNPLQPYIYSTQPYTAQQHQHAAATAYQLQPHTTSDINDFDLSKRMSVISIADSNDGLSDYSSAQQSIYPNIYSARNINRNTYYNPLQYTITQQQQYNNPYTSQQQLHHHQQQQFGAYNQTTQHQQSQQHYNTRGRGGGGLHRGRVRSIVNTIPRNTYNNQQQHNTQQQQHQTTQQQPQQTNHIQQLSYHNIQSNNPLVDAFKQTTNVTDISLLDVYNRGILLDLCTDQFGSRYIQQRLELHNNDEINLLFEQIVLHDYTNKLCLDVFGNYIIQKMFEIGSNQQNISLINTIKDNLYTLSIHMYGCRVIQHCIDICSIDIQNIIIDELSNYTLQCIRDANGNHVISKILSTIKDNNNLNKTTQQCIGHINELCIHAYGCRVIQRLFESNVDDKTINVIIDEIQSNIIELCMNQYANYVIQHIIQHNPYNNRSKIIHSIQGHFINLAKHKFASNVVEKCIQYGNDDDRQIILNEITNKQQQYLQQQQSPNGTQQSTDSNITTTDTPLLSLVRDQYGNFVIQRMLDKCSESQMNELVQQIRQHINVLRRMPYAKHILNKIDKITQYGRGNEPPANQQQFPTINNVYTNATTPLSQQQQQQQSSSNIATNNNTTTNRPLLSFAAVASQAQQRHLQQQQQLEQQRLQQQQQQQQSSQQAQISTTQASTQSPQQLQRTSSTNNNTNTNTNTNTNSTT